MKRINLTFLLILFVFALSACGSTADIAENEASDYEFSVGICFDTFVIERWQKDRDVLVSQIRDEGGEVIVQNANGDINEQIEQMEYLINKKVDVIIVVAIDNYSLSGTIKKAKDEGIKVISYDRLCLNSNCDLYITFDNELVGTLLGKNLADAVGDRANVIVLNGSPTDNNVQMVHDGFMDEAEVHHFNILDEIYIDNWDADLAYEYVNENIDTVKKADGIMCGNDAVATQVIRALSEYRLNDDIVVVGQDADLDACQHIVEGLQYMTVYKNVNDLAKEAARYAVAMAGGNDIEVNRTINDGGYDVPYVAMTPDAVTAQNIDAVIIDGGFHTQDEVYLNVR